MTTKTAEEIARQIVSDALSKPRSDDRFLIAIAGPPAAGKTTVSELVQAQLLSAGYNVGLVPMDGFHMDNSDLAELGLLDRKGAPETFLAEKFLAAIARLKAPGPIRFPGFDRAMDRVKPDAIAIQSDTDFVVIEGNYLLYSAEIWRDLIAFWDFSVFLDLPIGELRKRLVQRWIDYGLDAHAAQKRANSNDIPNAELLLGRRIKADLTVEYPLVGV